VAVEGEHIESNSQPRKVWALLQQLLRCANDAPLLGPIDAGRTTAELLAAAATHLGDDQRVVEPRYDVELAAATSIVAQQDLRTCCFEALRGGLFGVRADSGSRIHRLLQSSSRTLPPWICAQSSPRTMRRSGSSDRLPVTPGSLPAPGDRVRERKPS